MVLEPAHFVSTPAGDGSVVDSFGLVRHDEVFAYADYFAQTATDRAGSQRAVEAEHIFIRHLEGNTVKLEGRREAFFGIGVIGHPKKALTH